MYIVRQNLNFAAASVALPRQSGLLDIKPPMNLNQLLALNNQFSNNNFTLDKAPGSSRFIAVLPVAAARFSTIPTELHTNAGVLGM